MTNEVKEKILNFKCFEKHKHLIDDCMLRQLEKIYLESKNNKKLSIHNNIKMLIKYISYNVDGCWLERIKESKKYGHDTSSLEAYKVRYGEKVGYKLWLEKTKKTSLNKERYIKKHGVKAWKNLSYSRSVNNIDVLIEKYGKKEALKRKEKYLKNWKKSIKERGGWDNGISLEAYVEKYGKKEGYEKWNTKRQKQKYRFSVDYYKEKYGDAWEEEWNSYRKRMAEIAKKASRKNSSTYSKKSQKLFITILENCPITKEEVEFAENKGERIFTFEEYRDRMNAWWFSVDFIFKNKIIEFDGKYYHASEEVKNKDKLQTEILEKNGFQVLRIDEREYDNNRIEVVDKCIKFLME